MDKTEIKAATVEELANRLLEIKREEQDIMIELWERAPKVLEDTEKKLVKEMKPNESKGH